MTFDGRQECSFGTARMRGAVRKGMGGMKEGSRREGALALFTG